MNEETKPYLRMNFFLSFGETDNKIGFDPWLGLNRVRIIKSELGLFTSFGEGVLLILTNRLFVRAK